MKQIKEFFWKVRVRLYLPYKEHHEILVADFKLFKQRLKNLTRETEYDKNIFAEYDNIFKEQKTQYNRKSPSYHNLGKTRHFPHKPVIRHDRTTTVFDIVAKVDSLP